MEAKPKTAVRRGGWNALLCAVSLGAALGGAELLMRLAFERPPNVAVEPAADLADRLAGERENPTRASVGHNPGSLFLETPTGRRLRANSCLTIRNHRLGGRRVEICTNSLGYRNAELGEKARPRVLFLGDSITLADYLPEPETFVRGAETRLGGAIETINAGVGAIGLEDELAILVETGLSVEPDAVVVGFYPNDFQASPGVFVPALPPALRWSWLAQRIALAVALHRAPTPPANEAGRPPDLEAWQREFEREFPPGPGDFHSDPPAFHGLVVRHFHDWGAGFSAGAWRHMTPVFLEFARLADRHGFQLLFLVFPVRPQVEAKFVFDPPQRRLGEVADAIGAPVLDLLPVLREAAREQDGALFYDRCHHTPLGSAIIADAVAGFLREQLRPPPARRATRLPPGSSAPGRRRYPR